MLLELTLFFVLLLAIELLYFKVANNLNIIDKPNHRSSHSYITIRGGGIIIVLATLFYSLYDLESYRTYWSLYTGVLILGIISFADDIITLSNKIRLFFQLISLSAVFYSLNLFELPYVLLLYPMYIIISIGIINIYNFMDGINGITGLYSLVFFGSLYFFQSEFTFISINIYPFLIIALIVFGIFNFRPKAKCFLGDVGSVTIGFVAVYSILLIMIKTQNYWYVMLLFVYLLDAGITILHRLYLRQNIFKAHRMHFYQYLVNDKKIPHLKVSILYAMLQLLINIILFLVDGIPTIIKLSLVLFTVIMYLYFRFIHFRMFSVNE